MVLEDEGTNQDFEAEWVVVFETVYEEEEV